MASLAFINVSIEVYTFMNQQTEHNLSFLQVNRMKFISPIRSKYFVSRAVTILVSALLCSTPSAWAASTCSKQKPESVKAFLDGLSDGSIQIDDRIKLPFSTYFLNCKKGVKAGGTCATEQFASWVDVLKPSTETSKSKEQIKQERKQAKQDKKLAQTKRLAEGKENNAFSWVGTSGAEAVTEQIKHLENSGLRHVSLGEANFKSTTLKNGMLEIRLYKLNGEYFRTFEAQRSNNCINLISEWIPSFKNENGEIDDDQFPVFTTLPTISKN